MSWHYGCTPLRHQQDYKSSDVSGSAIQNTITSKELNSLRALNFSTALFGQE